MKGKIFFTLLSIAIVGTWLVMVSVLVMRTTAPHRVEGQGYAALSGVDPSQEWMEIYLDGDKVGYSSKSLTPLEEGYVVFDEIFLRLNLMGRVNEVRTVTRAVLDSNFLVERFDFDVYSGVVAFHASGEVKGDFMEVETGGAGGGDSVSRIALESRPTLGAGMDHFFKARPIRVGDSFRVPLFDPSTMAVTTVEITVAEKDSVEIKGVSYNGFRLEAEFWGTPVQFWIDEHGVLLKQQGVMGLTMVKAGGATAPFGLDASGGGDFYEIAAVKPRGRIKNPSQVSYLKIRLEGIQGAPGLESQPFEWTGPRQSLGPGGDILEIRSEDVPQPGAYILPYRAGDTAKEPYLAPGAGIQSDHPEIVSASMRIIGDTTDPAAAARRVLHWVYRNVEKRPVLSIPGAVEVLRTMTGDCNEHAVLLAALLRAAGIPARICAGLVYTRGRFYYHAWNEAYLGDWVSMDATVNQMPADATHIAVIRGGLDKQAAITGLIGRLGIEVLDYRY